ncbi:riboflavin kinase [Chaetomium fimeti]|uniref:Riboflavin kinase n=1 Tax=Chaetomium fimeti TaxID=1854472 RepID=A0AAE0HAF5_9PEZI|nr:riboflavin kinase [Chaetomium fimeti]
MATPTPNRPPLIGDPSGPSAPYPLHMSGLVISGFGRGSKELGIPTANLPVDEAQTPWISSTPSGVYFGWASLNLPASHPDSLTTTTTTTTAGEGEGKNADADTDANGQARRRGGNGFAVYPMVMSIGYNPFYKNTVRSAEVHVLHRFGSDFYGAEMRLLIAGFIREEKDYSGLEALIADIEFDCEVAKRSLAREGWAPSGVDVEVDVPGEGVKVLRGSLECGWLIRPEELGEGGK